MTIYEEILHPEQVSFDKNKNNLKMRKYYNVYFQNVIMHITKIISSSLISIKALVFFAKSLLHKSMFLCLKSI